MARLKTLDLSETSAAVITNTSFGAFRNSSIECIDLSINFLYQIDACAFCGLKLKKLFLHDNRLLHVDVALNSLYGLRGLSMDMINLHSIGNKWMELSYNLNQKLLSYLSEICLTTFILSKSSVSWVNYHFFTKPSAFRQCIQNLDFSSNILRGDIRSLELLHNMFNLKTLNLGDQRVYSLSKAACVLNEDMEYCHNRGFYHQHVAGLTLNFTLPSTMTQLNFSGSSNYFNDPPSMIGIQNAHQLKILDISYGSLGSCNTTITGLNNVQVREISRF